MKISYWITTGIVAVMMSYAAYNYLTSDVIRQAFHHLGFPDYFRVELGVAKIIGAVLLLVPVAARIKEWVYAGFGFTFISAFIAHVASGDPMFNRVMPLVLFAILIVSYITYHRKERAVREKTAGDRKMQLAA